MGGSWQKHEFCFSTRHKHFFRLQESMARGMGSVVGKTPFLYLCTIFSCSHTVKKYWYVSRSNRCDLFIFSLDSDSLYSGLRLIGLEKLNSSFQEGYSSSFFLIYAWECSKWDLLGFSSHQGFHIQKTIRFQSFSKGFQRETMVFCLLRKLTIASNWTSQKMKKHNMINFFDHSWFNISFNY